MWGPNKVSMGLPQNIYVVGIVTLTGQESIIFFSQNTCANAILNHFLTPHAFSAGLNRFDDIVVACAAADIALKLFSYRSLIKIVPISIYDIDRAHNHTWGTKPAL
jgi:hypothetical protein